MNNKCAVKYKCMNQIKNNLYLLIDGSSELIMCDLLTNKRYFIGKIQRDDSYFTTSCVAGEKIYYFSYYGNKFCVFDTNNKKLKYVKTDIELNGKRIGECSSCVFYKDSIYVLCGPNSIPLIKIDVLSDCTYACSDWISEGIKRYGCIVYSNTFCNPCIVDNNIWIPTNVPDVIIKYNMDENIYEFVELLKYNNVYNLIVFDGKNFWLSGNSTIIVKMNYSDVNSIERLEISDKILIRESILRKYTFYTGYIIGDYIYYLPLQSNYLLRVEMSTGNIELIKKINEDNYCFLSTELICDGKISVCMQIQNDNDKTTSLNMCHESDFWDFEFDESDMVYSNAINIEQNLSTIFIEKDKKMLNWFLRAVAE